MALRKGKDPESRKTAGVAEIAHEVAWESASSFQRAFGQTLTSMAVHAYDKSFVIMFIHLKCCTGPILVVAVSGISTT